MYLKIIGGHSENAVRQMTLFVLPTSICCLIALRGGGVGASLQKRGIVWSRRYGAAVSLFC